MLLTAPQLSQFLIFICAVVILAHSDTFGVKSSTLPRSGGYDKSYGDSVRLSSIRGVIHEVQMNICVVFFCLDVYLESVVIV